MNLEEKIALYYKLEKEILEELEKKDSNGMDCSCDEPEDFKYIFEGEWDEIQVVCSNCGGLIEQR